jgi:hypothetical protein
MNRAYTAALIGLTVMLRGIILLNDLTFLVIPWHILVIVIFFLYWLGLRYDLARLFYLPVVVGLLMNATVCLANGGFMPVVQMQIIAPTTFWMTVTNHSRFLFLCDRLPGHCSIGDWFIWGGCGLYLLMALVNQFVYEFPKTVWFKREKTMQEELAEWYEKHPKFAEEMRLVEEGMRSLAQECVLGEKA